VFLPEIELFDSELFGVMRTEALTMDPQQRLLLHAAHEALPEGPSAVFGRAYGAFVGIAGEQGSREHAHCVERAVRIASWPASGTISALSLACLASLHHDTRLYAPDFCPLPIPTCVQPRTTTR
jgi:acyl transferase domain-containing protein